MTAQNKQLSISNWKNELATGDTGKTRLSEILKHRLNLKDGGLRVRSVNVTKNDRHLIVTFENNSTIRVVDLEKLEYLPFDYAAHRATIRLTSITRDDRSFFTASWDGCYRKFEISSGKCSQVLSGIARSPSCFLEPEERFLFTASYDSDFNVASKNSGWCWDLSTGKTIHSYEHSADRIHHEAIDIAMDDGGVYTGSDDGRAYRWPLHGKQPLIEYFSFVGTVRKITVSSNLFAAACTDGTLRIRKKISGEELFNFPNAHTDLREVRISKDETKLWSASGHGSIFCYDLLSGKMIYKKTYHSSWIWSIALMQEEQILVSGGGDGQVIFTSANTGQLLARLYMLPDQHDFLITCPPDKSFPSGMFYTNNEDYIQVQAEDKANDSLVTLDKSDPRHTSYFNKHNLKNLILTRLKNKGQYDLMTSEHLKNKNLFLQAHAGRDFKRLRA